MVGWSSQPVVASSDKWIPLKLFKTKGFNVILKLLNDCNLLQMLCMSLPIKKLPVLSYLSFPPWELKLWQSFCVSNSLNFNGSFPNQKHWMHIGPDYSGNARVSLCKKDTAVMSGVLIHLAAAEVNSLWASYQSVLIQNISTTRKYHPKGLTGILLRCPAPSRDLPVWEARVSLPCKHTGCDT